MAAPEAPFEEPWQAQLFALTVAMNEAGHFSWTEWAEGFGPKVKEAPAHAYWHIWAEALVTLLGRLDIAEADEIHALTHRWLEAARTTPHGSPVEL